MKSAIKQSGFSLTEVLMAVGILSIGMMLVATMFPVGIYLTSVASERTMAAIVADEAFAKIQLYHNYIVPYTNPANSYDYESELGTNIDPNEFSYPSVDPHTVNPQYYWSALYKFDPNSAGYLVTVFVARKTSPALTYPDPSGSSSDRPRVIDVNVQNVGKSDELNVLDGNEAYVNPPATIFDTKTSQLYSVVERIGNVVTLNRDWDANAPNPRPVWLVPPPETGGRNAGIEVYQRIIKF